MEKNTVLNGEMSYNDYLLLLNNLVKEGKATGEEQSENLIKYTKLNHKRMQRIDKKGELTDGQIAEIKTLETPVEWIVLTESWCGDAAQTLPYMNKIAESNSNIELKVVLRDKNLKLMDAHLTNGGRSIPKLIMRDKNTKEILNTFGPRPSKATSLVQEFKNTHGSLTDDFKKELQLWYTKDKGQNTVDDLINILR